MTDVQGNSATAQSQIALQQRRHRVVGLSMAAVAAGMVGMSFAAVPLYKLYCQVTGYGGTTQRASKPSDVVIDKTMRVRFDGNVGPNLKWEFGPLQNTIDVKVGENALIFFRATNRSDRPLTGTSTFNVTPEVAGAYFAKVQCFCFTEQRLDPGESIDMPVSFYIDPAIVNDPDGKALNLVTLSYTFYPVPEKAAAVAAPKANGS
jgi:cytochrome c oxidase assembly protein subunit 11